ncbi:YdiU family protein [Alphaproteobacteria bacterium]|nr:YdiU family protein [Alphaproteobacteria bacterium]
MSKISENLSNLKHTYFSLGDEFSCRTKPTLVKKPSLINFNFDLASDLGLTFSNKKEIENILSGNKIPNNSLPIAMSYAGHQFGNFVPQLGDGRAVLLGEIKNKDNILYDIQLKGSGKTVFSRQGDGRAALGPVMREYLISEFMNAVEIPTTRSLAIIKTGENIVRESFLPGAILTRVSKSHIRIGTFEYFSSRRKQDSIKKLTNYIIQRNFSNIYNKKTKYIDFLEQVITKQAYLISKWMEIGFIHGVMNTDNTSISGETIDYGPCAFLDEFNRNMVFSSIDHMERYSYSNQPQIIKWNLARFAESIITLIDPNLNNAISIANELIGEFDKKYNTFWKKGMKKKIGLSKNEIGDESLILDLLKIMENNSLDYTATFRNLSDFLDINIELQDKKFDYLNSWLLRWKDRIKIESSKSEDLKKEMNNVNPIYIPRNHIVEKAINQAYNNNDYEIFLDFLNALNNPYKEKNKLSKFSEPPKPEEKVLQTFCGT